MRLLVSLKIINKSLINNDIFTLRNYMTQDEFWHAEVFWADSENFESWAKIHTAQKIQIKVTKTQNILVQKGETNIHCKINRSLKFDHQANLTGS